MILGARIQMLLKFPFYGTLATRLVPVDVTEQVVNGKPWLSTAATDGKHFFYNRNFVLGLERDEWTFLFAHEVMHNVYDHINSRGHRDPQLYNAACDYVINGELVDAKVGRLIKHELCNPCYDERFRGKSSDEVYSILLSEQERNKDKNKNGQGAAGPGTFDDHIDPTDPDNPYNMSQEEWESLGQDIRAAVIESAKANRAAGNLPAGVERLLKEILEPQINWRELLLQNIQSQLKSDFSFSKHNRRNSGNTFLLPGMIVEQAVECDIAFDTSGSMTNQMLRDMLSETIGIMTQYQDFRVRVWCFDTKVYNMQEFTPDNFEEAEEYKFVGGGGTLFECNWEWMRENDIQPRKLILFTDGYPCGGWCPPGDEEYCDTLFIVHGDPSNEIKAPFGQTVHYNDHRT